MPLPKKTIDFIIGVIIFVAVALLLNLTFKVDMLLSFVIALVISIICAFTADALQGEK